jgi:hypothetical protein
MKRIRFIIGLPSSLVLWSMIPHLQYIQPSGKTQGERNGADLMVLINGGKGGDKMRTRAVMIWALLQAPHSSLKE